MRLWSISLSYLDSKRLNAQWREALLCRKVLEGNTNGYKHHPQFLRVKNHAQPFYFINMYLYEIWQEAYNRGYKYDRNKLIEGLSNVYGDKLEQMVITKKQLLYEFSHLQLKIHNTKKYDDNIKQMNIDKKIKCGQMFDIKEGPIMDFEVIKA